MAQTCKVWKDTLDAVEQTLWKGLVAKHNPTLVQITDMLPDNVGEGQAPKTMRAKGDGTIITVPSPSKNWKDQMKRHKLLSNQGFLIEMVGDLKEIDSYIFQIRYMVKLQKAEGEHSDVIEAIDLKAASLTRNSTKLSPITIPNSADADAVEVLAVDIYVIDKTTGRQAALTTGRGNGDCALGLKFFVPKHSRDEGAGAVACFGRQMVRTTKIADDDVSWAMMIAILFHPVIMNATRGEDTGRNMRGASLKNYQILWFLRHDLCWN